MPSVDSADWLHNARGLPKISVVIPCFRVTSHILEVLQAIGPECSEIFVIDDCCPDSTGRLVESRTDDPRIRIIYHENNQGVGGAVITGYHAALAANADIIVKIDGDGQMDPRLIPKIISPILQGGADYTKGNRFFSIYNVKSMPTVRLFGNAILSFMTKISSGYWTIFDPTNGFTAIHAAALQQIELRNISRRYFFESDMLINLGGARAVVQDIPMEAFYGSEISGLKIRLVLREFLSRNLRETAKRILYNYYLRDFNVASLNIIAGSLFLGFGAVFGFIHWCRSALIGVPATTGTVMIAVLPILLGFQFLMNALAYDMSNEPKIPLQRAGSAERVRLLLSVTAREVEAKQAPCQENND